MYVCVYVCMHVFVSGSSSAVAAGLLHANSAHSTLVFGFQAACNRSRGTAVAGDSWHLFLNMAWTSRQPATAVAEERIVPTCATFARSGFGARTTTYAITENISIDVGFGGKQQHQAASIVVDNGDERWRFVHVKKQSPWFVAAVGGPMQKRERRNRTCCAAHV